MPRSSARKYRIVEAVVPEVLELEGPLSIEVQALLYAFELAAPHVKKGGTYASRLAEQQELALGLIDWAVCETDRGAQLLKEKTREGYGQ